MARPRDEDKRHAILLAATEVVAEQGLGAPTARIAKVAGVAEGTVFTYFATKDELLNQLYLELKSSLREAMLAGLPASGTARERLRHAWQQYVRWGVLQPQGRKALAQLSVSDRVTAQTRAAGNQGFAAIQATLKESMAGGPQRDRPAAFVSAIMTALAETTMDFMAREPDRADDYAASGFEALWNSISR